MSTDIRKLTAARSTIEKAFTEAHGRLLAARDGLALGNLARLSDATLAHAQCEELQRAGQTVTAQIEAVTAAAQTAAETKAAASAPAAMLQAGRSYLVNARKHWGIERELREVAARAGRAASCDDTAAPGIFAAMVESINATAAAGNVARAEMLRLLPLLGRDDAVRITRELNAEGIGTQPERLATYTADAAAVALNLPASRVCPGPATGDAWGHVRGVQNV